jgi:hypothetical protein
VCILGVDLGTASCSSRVIETSEPDGKVVAAGCADGMRGGMAKIPVRKALLYFALRRLGLDTDPMARRPQDQQIVLLNHEQVAAAMARGNRKS